MAAIKEEWIGIESSKLIKLIESMPRRCAAVLENNSLPTKQ